MLCFSCRMSTSSATRRLSSTWVASTTMQRKWRDDYPSSSFRIHRRTNEWSKGGRPGLKNSVDFESPFPYFIVLLEWNSKVNFTATRTKDNNEKRQNEKSVSNSERIHRRVPAGAGGCADCPCVIHILTSVFQCEGRIITWVLWSANSNMKPVKYKRLLNRNYDTLCV